MLGAETEGAIGYMIEQELGNVLPFEKPIATLLTMVEVDPDDPAFQDPTKFIGKVYDEAEAKAEAAGQGLDGQARRQALAPGRALAAAASGSSSSARSQWLLEKGTVVIAAGGGGIPTMYEKGTRRLVGVECVIDKDRATALLATRDRSRRPSSAPPTPTPSTSTGASPGSGRSAAPRRTRWTPTTSPPAPWARRSRRRRTSPAPPVAVSIICSLADVPAAVRGEKGTTIAPDAGATAFH